LSGSFLLFTKTPNHHSENKNKKNNQRQHQREWPLGADSGVFDFFFVDGGDEPVAEFSNSNFARTFTIILTSGRKNTTSTYWILKDEIGGNKEGDN